MLTSCSPDVTVSDGHHVDTAVVTVFVDDVNEHQPIFENISKHSIQVPENSTIGSVSYFH